jgi:hypothetical protein
MFERREEEDRETRAHMTGRNESDEKTQKQKKSKKRKVERDGARFESRMGFFTQSVSYVPSSFPHAFHHHIDHTDNKKKRKRLPPTLSVRGAACTEERAGLAKPGYNGT